MSEPPLHVRRLRDVNMRATSSYKSRLPTPRVPTMSQTLQDAMQQQANGEQEHRPDEPGLLDQVIANTRIEDRPQSLESEQLQIQVVTAKKYGRSIRQFLAEAKSMATINQETAASCFYSVPRAGKTISGPSVRLAEICMSCWGHLDAGTRVKEIAASYVIVEGFAWDMCRNIKVRQEVRRNIVTKTGKRYGEDMIGNTVNAAASIALRNAILRVIPRAYVDQLWEDARKVAVGDAKTLSATRDTAISYFTKMGVLVERIYTALGVQGIEDVTIDHVGVLKGFATAIKDGESTVDECFPGPEQPKTGLPSKGGSLKGAEPPKEDAKPTELPTAETPTEPTAKPKKPKAPKETPQPPQEPAQQPTTDAPPLADGEVPNEPTDAPMGAAEKAAIAEAEAAEMFDPENAGKDALITQIKRHLVRLGKTKPSAETWAFSQASIGKKDLASGTEAELRYVFRALSKMEPQQ